ncbi:U6 snRNA phosphodiesterase, partial [Chelonus insularis]|uniref:U6 snRNA phosphodiesterase n=1 Tax=Chelonus insularis TaxID=460826 RepID=UPI00158884ED
MHVQRMAGFKLIQNYSSSESDEDHDEKELQTDSIITNIPPSNSKQLLPLPDNFTLWTVKNNTNSNTSPLDITNDNDEETEQQKHDGRIRSFKHERGNWATLVYIEYEPDELLLKWMKSVQEKLPVDGKLIIENSHISLTRTLIFKFHWIESFVDSMKKICQATNPFIIEMINVKLYCNEERTRTFMGIECQCLDPSFTSLMKLLNKLLAEYQLSSFYEDASYHISFLWVLGDKQNELQPYIASLNDDLNEILSQDLEKNYIRVSKLHCKIGNKIYIFTLK